MTTMLRMTAIAGAVALSGYAIAPVFAQEPAPGPPHRRMGPGGPGMGRGPGGPGLLGDFARGLRGLNLTDAQRDQVRGIVESHQAATREIAERMRAAHQGLEAAVTADTLNESAIREKSAEVAAVQADAAVLRARVHQDVFSILTAEQQARAKELKAEAQKRMQERAQRLQERRSQRQPKP